MNLVATSAPIATIHPFHPSIYPTAVLQEVWQVYEALALHPQRQLHRGRRLRQRARRLCAGQRELEAGDPAQHPEVHQGSSFF